MLFKITRIVEKCMVLVYLHEIGFTFWTKAAKLLQTV